MANNISFGKSDYSKLIDNSKDDLYVAEVDPIAEFNEEDYNKSLLQLKDAMDTLITCYKAKPMKELGDLITELEQIVNNL